MDMITRRSAIRAIGLIPAIGVAVAPALAAGKEPAQPLLASASPLERAEWHFAELVRLLDELPPSELHVVLQRIREPVS